MDSSTVTPIPPAPQTPYRFLYREFGREQDIIWRVVPSDPTQREQLAVIPHRADWGIIPSLSPDGQLLAYTSFPEGAADRSLQSEAYVLDLSKAKTELIAKSVDLRFRPLWSPDGKLLFLRRNFQQEVAILMADLTRKEDETPTPGPDEDSRRVTAILRANLGSVQSFIPIGFAHDKRSLYFVQIQGPGSGGGTVLGAYAPATIEALATATAVAAPGAEAPSPTPQTRFVLTLSKEQIAQDYNLSPDSRKLTFLVQQLIEGKFLFRAFVADLVDNSVVTLPAEGLAAGDHLRPLWHPDGTRITVGLLPASREPGPVALVPLDGGPPSFLPPPDVGFDLPLSWGPDGTYLAVTSFEGQSFANPGKARLVLIAPTGHRVTVAEGVDVEVVGWVKEE